ncbi:Protein SPIRAL1-like 1, partial [Mucuna pruriens]
MFIYSCYIVCIASNVTDSVVISLATPNKREMGRGVSSGGGQSSLGYLFGSGEPASNGARAQNANASPPPVEKQIPAPVEKQTPAPVEKHIASPIDKQIPAGIPGSLKNNYHRADGQNCGNFLTDRPSTKVHAAPGGGSSLDYLFGGPPGNKIERNQTCFVVFTRQML